MEDEGQPDTSLLESDDSYIVRSVRERTYLAEISFVSGVWYIDEWVPGKTLHFRKNDRVVK